MSSIDWLVLAGTILSIVFYGVYHSRRTKTMEGYLRGNSQLGWLTVGLSVMATQASAITFLSTPGVGFQKGMGFVQFYFGMPIAVVVVSAIFVPRYYALGVYTAYEFLESRFGLPMRMYAASLFLISRGLAAGITIYAPAIVLSSILGWSLEALNLAIGIAVIIYTVAGGTSVVSQTQKQQMIIIFFGMMIATIILYNKLPSDLTFGDSVALAGVLGKMQIVDLDLDWSTRYNIWSGLAGDFSGFILLWYRSVSSPKIFSWQKRCPESAWFIVQWFF